MILDRPTHYPMILVNWEYKRQYSCNFIIVAIIYVLHQMSAQYKNINNTKLDKSIVYSISADNDKVYLGQVRFLRT